MASITASAEEDQIASCVDLLLSRKADPNVADRWGPKGGYPVPYALSHSYWCRPNRNTPDWPWTTQKVGGWRKESWIEFPLMALVLFNCHVVALWVPHCSLLCVCICVFCLQRPVMACACTDGHQTDRQTNTQCNNWAGGSWNLLLQAWMHPGVITGWPRRGRCSCSNINQRELEVAMDVTNVLHCFGKKQEKMGEKEANTAIGSGSND